MVLWFVIWIVDCVGKIVVFFVCSFDIWFDLNLLLLSLLNLLFVLNGLFCVF